MTDNPGVYPVVLTPEQAERADDLERRIAEGEPTLTTYMLSDLEEQFHAR